VLDTTPEDRPRESWRVLADFVRSPYLAKGWSLLRQAKSRTRFVSGVTQLRALGTGKLDHVAYVCAARQAVIPARMLLVHQGVVPGINLSSAIGCAHRWDDAQCCFAPAVDAWGASSVPWHHDRRRRGRNRWGTRGRGARVAGGVGRRAASSDR
jgi:hypothetical protein